MAPLLSIPNVRPVWPKLGAARNYRPPNTRLYNTRASGYEVRATAEPLARYQPGGYHPIHIGAQFKYGRYRVTHKLGWGGEGTVWLARDLQASQLVVLKVLVAEQSGCNEESALLKQLFEGSGKQDHPGIDHVTQLLDTFVHTGVNGNHECLVLHVAGTNALDHAQRYANKRLPAIAAWKIAKQIVLAVDRLHSLRVAHADLHTRNVMLSPTRNHYSEPALLENLPQPDVADVNVLPPNVRDHHMPKYLVEATTLPYPLTDPHLWHAHLVDFGQSFRFESIPKQSRTPLVLRAPEMLLLKEWDYRVDIWSLACLIFELVTGKSPFNPENPSQNRLVQEWKDLFGDLPAGWRSPWSYSTQWGDDEEIGIAGWLKQCYGQREHDGEIGNELEDQQFSEENLDMLGDLLEHMFRYKPGERLATGEIIKHAFFAKNPLEK